MLLLIDAGNTFIKWALIAHNTQRTSTMPAWTSSGQLRHHELDRLESRLRKIHAQSPIRRAIISNVAGNTIRDRLSAVLQKVQPEPEELQWFLSGASRGGVKNAYEVANQLGSDRFATLIGARSLYPDQNLLLVTCGTATTIDALQADGSFIGGMILPGLALMAKSLMGNTALLPGIDKSAEALPLFATNTVTAIQSGCMRAQAGSISLAFHAFEKENTDARCILSGGAAAAILPYLSQPAEIVDNLVLIGLFAATSSQPST